MADLIISKSGTKHSAKDFNVSADFYGALDKKVKVLIGEAVSRAKSNGRRTIRPQDL
ncbi:MAG: DUF1931 domain-containing protein [Elusimicrobia bacterium]|nr:DUF1931 domain-containing protein [Elusimicrobiota bacterium]